LIAVDALLPLLPPCQLLFQRLAPPRYDISAARYAPAAATPPLMMPRVERRCRQSHAYKDMRCAAELLLSACDAAFIADAAARCYDAMILPPPAYYAYGADWR